MKPLPWSYPVVMLCAIAAGLIVSKRSQERLNIDSKQRWAILFGAFCGAMFGSKILFLLIYNVSNASVAPSLFDGGKTILGGLVGGYFGVELVKWSMGMKIKTGDSFAAPVATSIAVGRLACFLGGCCYGTPTSLPWGVDFGDGIARHPTQIYEFFFHSVAAFVLWRFQSAGYFKRQLIKLYILAYLLYRFVTEFIRPEPRLVGGLTGYQIAALAFIPVFVGLWIVDKQIPTEAQA